VTGKARGLVVEKQESCEQRLQMADLAEKAQVGERA